MNVKTKIFVLLAIIVGVFYTIEVVLSLVTAGFTGPVVTKGAIAAAALFYATYSIAKGRAPKSIGAKSAAKS